MVSKQNLENIADSWKVVAEIPDYQLVAGNILFKKIFEIAPGAHKLFSFGANYENADDEMFEEPKMMQHFLSLFGTIDAAVQLHLEGKDEELIKVCKQLGKRHYIYGVREAHYPIVGEALLFTLGAALGDERFNADVKSAWANFYGIISDAMMEGCEVGERNASLRRSVNQGSTAVQ